MVEEGLKAIDRTHLPGKFKCCRFAFGLYPRKTCPLMMYGVVLTRVERIEQRCAQRVYKKVAGSPKDHEQYSNIWTNRSAAVTICIHRRGV